MKVIIKAMLETEFKPRAKWWGFVKDDKRYLMRYHHTIMVTDRSKILYTFWETRTDKAGLLFAISNFNKNK